MKLTPTGYEDTIYTPGQLDIGHTSQAGQGNQLVPIQRGGVEIKEQFLGKEGNKDGADAGQEGSEDALHFLDQDPTGTRKIVYRMQVLQELTRTANANRHNTIFMTELGTPSPGILPLPATRDLRAI